MPKIRIQINSKVSSEAIRREMSNGREHIVIPSRTLPFGVVMNGGLYTREEITANYKQLEGTLAPLGHPKIDGKFVSAFTPEAINAHHVGAFNRNVRLEGNRVYVEKWIDVETAGESEEGKRLLERIEALEKGEGEPVHTSVAAFVEREPAVNADGYKWVARIDALDHDAILLDEPGAATPEDGVGLMVNADQAQVYLAANAGALKTEGYHERERRVQAAVSARWPSGTNVAGEYSYTWISELNDDELIVMFNGGKAELYSYSIEGGKVVIGDVGTPVERQESWMTMAVNAAKRLFNPQANRPATNQKEGDMPITAEERNEIVKDVAAAVGTAMADQLKPLTETVGTLVANQKAMQEQLNAPNKAKEDEMRAAVGAALGEIVANSLQGEALASAFAKVSTGKPLGSASMATNADKGEAPDFSQAIA